MDQAPRANPFRDILLGRHGETEWNRVGRWQGTTDIPLSDIGRAQARALAERLRASGIVRVYTSHLSRARETAEIIAATLALEGPLVVDARLRERGYGCFEGLTRAECETRHPEAWQRYLVDRRAVPPDAEPPSEIVARVSGALRDIATAADLPGNGAVLVISHGGTIRTFVQAELGILLPPLANGATFGLRFADGKFALGSPDPPGPPAS